MEVTVDGGCIGEYPTTKRYSMHSEDEELALVYRHRKTFGIGHGCAAVWPDTDGEMPNSISAEPLPITVVRGLTNDVDLPEAAREAVSLRWLSTARPADELGEKRVEENTLPEALVESRQIAARLKTVGVARAHVVPLVPNEPLGPLSVE
jgi:hypothetical protein